MFGTKTYHWYHLFLNLVAKRDKLEEACKIELFRQQSVTEELSSMIEGQLTEETRRPMDMVCEALVILGLFNID